MFEVSKILLISLHLRKLFESILFKENDAIDSEFLGGIVTSNPTQNFTRDIHLAYLIILDESFRA